MTQNKVENDLSQILHAFFYARLIVAQLGCNAKFGIYPARPDILSGHAALWADFALARQEAV